jgi:hypothetical protein
MSTILDSLKKSSDQRDGKPKSAIDGFSFSTGKKPSLKFIYLLAFLLMMLVIAAIYWGYGYLYNDTDVSEALTTQTPQSQQQMDRTAAGQKKPETRQSRDEYVQPNNTNKVQKPNSTEVKQQLKTIAATNSKKQQEQKLRDLNRQPKPETEQLGQGQKKDQPVQSVQLGQKKGNKKTDLAQAQKTESENNRNKKKQAAKTEIPRQKYLYVYQLPFNIRKDIPKLRLNIHVYDEDPEKRIAIINGVRFKINETIEEQVSVLDIIKEGVVLSFNGEKFLIPK